MENAEGLTIEQQFTVQKFKIDVQQMNKEEAQKALILLFEELMHMDNYYRQAIMNK